MPLPHNLWPHRCSDGVAALGPVGRDFTGRYSYALFLAGGRGVWLSRFAMMTAWGVAPAGLARPGSHRPGCPKRPARPSCGWRWRCPHRVGLRRSAAGQCSAEAVSRRPQDGAASSPVLPHLLITATGRCASMTASMRLRSAWRRVFRCSAPHVGDRGVLVPPAGRSDPCVAPQPPWSRFSAVYGAQRRCRDRGSGISAAAVVRPTMLINADNPTVSTASREVREGRSSAPGWELTLYSSGPVAWLRRWRR